MYLESICLQNFRLFETFHLRFNKSLNLIVGENNSGKTALIDAIRYALDTNSSEWIRIVEDDFFQNSTSFSIQLRFDEISPTQASVFVEHLTHEQHDGQRHSVLYVNLLATITDQTKRGVKFIKTDIRSGSAANGPRIEREIRNFLSTTYMKPLRDAKAEMAAGRGSRLSQILSTSDSLINNPTNLDALIGAILDANSAIIGNAGIKENREKVKNRLQELAFTHDNFSPGIEILGNKPIEDMNDLEKMQTFKMILEKLSLVLDSNKPFQGLGYNNLLYMATELLLLEQESDDFPLLLIEEPEAHLHPQLQMKLLKFIRENFSQTGSSKLQSILTSHSPNLASKAPLESIIIMVNGKAFSLRKDETQLDEGDYTFLEKFLDVTKSNLFFAKGVLIVEGDGEKILLPTLAKLLGRPLENFGASIVDIGNTAFARYAKIFKRKGLDSAENQHQWLPVKVANVRDVDLWPDKAEEKPENPYGFVTKKEPTNGRGGNLNYWLSCHTDGGIEKRTQLKNIEGQNVRVFISDVWTFEYSLAVNGLAKEVYAAAKGEVGDIVTLEQKNSDYFNEFPSDDEERAIFIYRIIASNKLKTSLAYNLSLLLTATYSSPESVNQLRSKLPLYLIEAIEYVTEALPPMESGEND